MRKICLCAMIVFLVLITQSICQAGYWQEAVPLIKMSGSFQPGKKASLSTKTLTTQSEEFLDVTKAPYYARNDGKETDARYNCGAIQKACDDAAVKKITVYFPDGLYYFDGSSPVIIPSGVNIKMQSNSAIIKLKRELDPKQFRGIFAFSGENNIISGGTLCGERANNEKVAGGSGGFGIYIKGNKQNICVTNMETCNFRGDGIQITGSLSYLPENIVLDNVNSHHNSRQGLSLVSGRKIIIKNSKFNNNTGDSDGPCAGIDIEPDPEYSKVCLQEVHIENVQAMDNERGILIQLCNITTLPPLVDITLNGIYTNTSENSSQGLRNFILQGPKSVFPVGTITIDNFEGNGYFQICTWSCIDKLKLIFNQSSNGKISAGVRKTSIRG